MCVLCECVWAPVRVPFHVMLAAILGAVYSILDTAFVCYVLHIRAHMQHTAHKESTAIQNNRAPAIEERQWSIEKKMVLWIGRIENHTLTAQQCHVKREREQETRWCTRISGLQNKQETRETGLWNKTQKKIEIEIKIENLWKFNLIYRSSI